MHRIILTLLMLYSSVNLLAQQAERLTLLFVGDLMQHRAQLDAARTADGRYNYTSCFSLLQPVISQADILYMTRVQRERFTDLMEYERVKDVYILRKSMLKGARDNMRILHPLPRVNEIAYDVDSDPHAYYFQQAQNGLYTRQAIICDVLGITLDEIKK